MRGIVALSVMLGLSRTADAQQRVLGLDVSAWQGGISTTAWTTLKRPVDQQVGGVSGDGRDFVIIRSSRGGTTGYYDQSDADNSNGLNTLSQRYDDPYFVQNITRSTAAGLFAGAYHFVRADIISTTPAAGGIANTGADEADHMIQMAGPWIRPGYLLPSLDLESGAAQRSTAALSTFAVDFASRILAVTGVRPMVYVNSSYANVEVNATVAAAMPDLWIARPGTVDPLTAQPPPAASYPNVYGVWNPAYPAVPTPAPWKFWQYDSGAGLNGYTGNIDKNAANGGIEFLKDHLVPALWMTDAGGDWTTQGNWNSGQPPVAPVQGPGQVARVGTLTLPAVRLPGANDTVLLDRGAADVTVTLAAGAHTVRKLLARESLAITGGSLTLGYTPSPDSTPWSARFSAPVTLSGTASLSLHTLLVDAAQAFTLAGGAFTFQSVLLAPGAGSPASPGKILATGDVSLTPLANGASTISTAAGTGQPGVLDLGGAARSFTIGNGTAEVDLTVSVPVTNGALVKTGPGTLRLAADCTHTGGTTVQAGRLDLAASLGSGLTVTGGTLTLGAAPGSRTVNGSLALSAGATLQVRINSPAAFDQVRLTGSTAAIFLGGALDLTAAPGLAPGTVFRLLDNTAGTAPVTGAFAGKPEGALFTASGQNWVVSYLGGDGNDVTLTVATPLHLWRAAHFATAASTGPSADLADPDQDGLPNLLEYALGGNPLASSQTIQPALIQTGGRLGLAFTRLPATTDVTLTVQAADDLTGPWADLASSTSGAPTTPRQPGVTVTESGSGTTRLVQVSDLHPVSDPLHPRRFMRVKVAQP